jgi:hypothetical protein
MEMSSPTDESSTLSGTKRSAPAPGESTTKVSFLDLVSADVRVELAYFYFWTYVDFPQPRNARWLARVLNIHVKGFVRLPPSHVHFLPCAHVVPYLISIPFHVSGSLSAMGVCSQCYNQRSLAVKFGKTY